MKMSNCKLKRYQRLSLLEYHIHISIYTCVLITLKTKTDNTIKTTPIIIIIENFEKSQNNVKKIQNSKGNNNNSKNINNLTKFRGTGLNTLRMSPGLFLEKQTTTEKYNKDKNRRKTNEHQCPFSTPDYA